MLSSPLSFIYFLRVSNDHYKGRVNLGSNRIRIKKKSIIQVEALTIEAGNGRLPLTSWRGNVGKVVPVRSAVVYFPHLCYNFDIFFIASAMSVLIASTLVCLWSPRLHRH